MIFSAFFGDIKKIVQFNEEKAKVWLSEKCVDPQSLGGEGRSTVLLGIFGGGVVRVRVSWWV